MSRRTPAKLRLSAVLVLVMGVFLTCTEQPPTETDFERSLPTISAFKEGQLLYVAPSPPKLFTGTYSCTSGESVLAIQDVIPWAPGGGSGLGAVADELIAQGLNFCIIGSADIGTTNLARFPMVILAPAQDQTFYDNLFPSGTVHSDITSYVQGGGVLSAFLTDHATGPGNNGNWDGDVFVGGLQHTPSFVNDNSIADGTHPIVASGLPCAGGNCGTIVDAGTQNDLDGWGFSSHGFFTNLPTGTHTIVEQPDGNGDTQPDPVLIEYPFGSGVVIASLTTTAWRYVGGFGGLPINKKLMANEIADQTLSVKVNVEDSGGPVDGLVVTLVNSVLGPFALDDEPTIGVTANGGMTAFVGLSPGGYGAHVRDLISSDNATVNGTFVAPGVVAPLQGGDYAPTILLRVNNPGIVSEALVSSEQYLNMVDFPPISIDATTRHAEVTVNVVLLADGTTTAELLDPEGNCQNAYVMLLEEMRRPNGDLLPWVVDRISGDEIPAILVMTSPSDQNCGVELPLPETQTFLQTNVDENGNGTATVLTVEDRGQDLGTLVGTPTACTTEMIDEAIGDGRLGKVDFDKVFFGRKGEFDAASNKVPLDQLYIYYDQIDAVRGFGHATLVVQYTKSQYLDAWQQLFEIEYGCVNGECTFYGPSPQLFAGVDFTVVDAAENRTRVSWMLNTIWNDKPITAIQFKLKTRGDRAPNSRPRWRTIDLTEVCTTELGADPRLWIGH